MSGKTGIEWTDETWNPVVARRLDGGAAGWHCERVSAGCEHCYAEHINRVRFGTGLGYVRGSREQVEVYLDEQRLRAPLHWLKPRRVFVGSMTDIFGEWVTDDMLDQLFAVMALTTHITYQILTKRPRRMRDYLAAQRSRDGIQRAMWDTGVLPPEAAIYGWIWPLPNVWLGVSVEDQRTADERIPRLLRTPAAMRFLSCEPLLGPVVLTPYLHDSDCWARFNEPPRGLCICNEPREDHISWVICGGESGSHARPFDLQWARDLRDQCRAAGVAFFYKQGGASNRCSHSPHGGHIACFPKDLLVREFPKEVSRCGTGGSTCYDEAT